MSVGDVMYHSETGASQFTLDIANTRSRIESLNTGRGAVRAIETGALGENIVEYVVEEQRVTTDGITTEDPDQPWTLRVSPNGWFASARHRVCAGRRCPDLPAAGAAAVDYRRINSCTASARIPPSA